LRISCNASTKRPVLIEAKSVEKSQTQSQTPSKFTLTQHQQFAPRQTLTKTSHAQFLSLPFASKRPDQFNYTQSSAAAAAK
jgi:hypothetical protein